nr:hypothetical protein [Acinetobacter tandoii]
MKKLTILAQCSLYIAVCLIPSSIIWIFNYYPILLSENSLLYLHATSAQIISALIALSLVAYTFLNGELSQKLRDDPTLEDAIFLTKNNAFKDLSVTVFVGLFSIATSLIVLSSFKYQSIQDFFIVTSFISLILFTFTLLNFIHRSFLPESVQKNNDEVLKESQLILNEVISSNLESDTKRSIESSLGSFFIEFSKFENQLRKIYSIYNPNHSKNMPISRIVHELINLQIIPEHYAKEIIYLLRIRNSLAHSSHNTDLNSTDIENWVRFIQEIIKSLDQD